VIKGKELTTSSEVIPAFQQLLLPSARSLWQLKRHVTSDTMKQLVVAVILSRLDYCNSVLADLP